MIKKIPHTEIQATKPSIENVKKANRHKIALLCENIRSLHNVGAIFRTAEGALVEKIYLCGITGIPPRKEIEKTALGACDIVPWEYKENAADLARELKSKGYNLVALELTYQSVPYYEFECEFPVCLVVGNEVDGISDELLAECDNAIDIPMRGRANSLNVATACGIAVYELLRQYEKVLKK
jgi:tRNA G18 (ribose-2'-O)-methylase SpoU